MSIWEMNSDISYVIVRNDTAQLLFVLMSDLINTWSVIEYLL